MAVFDGVHYSLSTSLSPARRNELAAVLDLNGAVSHPPYTHVIAPPASHANATPHKLVTDRWVDRSVVLGKLQPEQYYSPDPAMIFSGVVACATDLSASDLEVLSAGITALGGQWRMGLTRDVTHLFALRAGTDKYNTALHFAPQTHMLIVTPHWFDDAVRLGRRIPEAPYAWPDPQVLRPGTTHENDDDMESRRKRKKTAGETEGESGDPADQAQRVRVWADRRILLSASLELAGSSRGAIEARIVRAGGVVVPLAETADEDAEEKAVDECDVLITRWRSGKSYFKAARASLLIGTLSWLFSVESSGTLHSPLDSLLWYPTPRGGIPGLIDCEISVTNYTGAARDYLKRLITLIGAKFTPSMSQSNKVLVAGFQPSPKTTRALAWSIPVVNHTWLEDCLVEWRALTVGLERYIVFPPGIDFGKMLMTREDGPPSSQTAPPNLSGGAVPGGRGVGSVDVDQDESLDDEYRRAHPHTTRGTAKDSTSMNVTSTSVKKTPTSVRRSGVATASGTVNGTGSAMGAFVDRVVPLPVDDEDDEVGDGRTPLSGRGQGRGRGRARMKVRSSLAVPAVEDRIRTPGGASAKERRAKGAMNDGSDGSDVGLVPPRRVMTGSATPVKSGMRGRTGRSLSRPSSGDEGGRSEREESRVRTSVNKDKDKDKPKSKPKSQRTPKEKEKAKTKEAEEERDGDRGRPGPKPKEKEKGQGKPRTTETKQARARSPRSPSSSLSPLLVSPPKTGLKRRLSVVVPSVPKDYFSSQSARATDDERDPGRGAIKDKENADGAARTERKMLGPAGSVQAVAAETSATVRKRGRPPKKKTTAPPDLNPKSKPGPKVKAMPKLPVESEDEDDEPSMVVEISVPSTSRGPRRSAADKATARLRDEVMPDVMSYEKEQKMAKRRRSEGSSVVSVSSVRDDEERAEKVGKKRRVEKEVEEVEEEAEVEGVVSASVPSVRGKPGPKARAGVGKKNATTDDEDMEEGPAKPKSKPRVSIGKGKRGTTTDDDMDVDENVSTAKSKLGAQGKKGRGRKEGIVRLLTTGVILSDDVIKRLTKLGVQMTTKPSDCTHLVAKGIVRTEKFLCALAVSPWILTDEWANASAKSGKLLPEKDYLMTDAAAEQRWDFNFVDAMQRAKGPTGGPNLFHGKTFYVTPKVSVDAKLLRNVVSAGGGQVQTNMPTVRILRGKPDRYVVSCPEDRAIWRPLVEEGYRVYSAELILRGALRQEVEWDRVECIVAG